jgi:hypothetical protein
VQVEEHRRTPELLLEPPDLHLPPHRITAEPLPRW